MPALDHTEKQPRAPWIEPRVDYLDVEETSVFPGVGRDGQPNFPDCTRS
jgi:hypothetical protein